MKLAGVAAIQLELALSNPLFFLHWRSTSWSATPFQCLENSEATEKNCKEYVNVCMANRSDRTVHLL
jgi:hypothetical protein